MDASAFYAGIPFGSEKEYYTTSLVYEEIKHIKNNHDAIGVLLETNRLKIMEPDICSTTLAIEVAKKTGDYQQLSKQDISVIALGISLTGQIITDDFAISNVAKNLDLKTSSVMTNGIKDIGKWIHYCPGCHKSYQTKTECPICGSPLRRKLKKSISSPNK